MWAAIKSQTVQTKPDQRYFDAFKRKYLDTEQGRRHLAFYDRERAEVKDVFEQIRKKHEEGLDITIDVLHKLLPHQDNQYTQKSGYRISTWPVIDIDIKTWFENAHWQTSDNWPAVARAIFGLIDGLLKDRDPNRLTDFRSDHVLSKGFKTAMLSPILYCLDPTHFLVINNKNVKTINFLLQRDAIDTLTQYFENMQVIRDAIKEFGINEFENYDMFDAFCHYMVSRKLGGYAAGKRATPRGAKETPFDGFNAKDFAACTGEKADARYLYDQFKLLRDALISKIDDPKLQDFTNYVARPFERQYRGVRPRDHMWLSFADKKYRRAQEGIQLQVWTNRNDSFSVGIWLEKRAPQAREEAKTSIQRSPDQFLKLIRSLEGFKFGLIGPTFKKDTALATDGDVRVFSDNLSNENTHAYITKTFSKDEIIKQGVSQPFLIRHFTCAS
jgi:hypothetical protein